MYYVGAIHKYILLQCEIKDITEYDYKAFDKFQLLCRFRSVFLHAIS